MSAEAFGLRLCLGVVAGFRVRNHFRLSCGFQVWNYLFFRCLIDHGISGWRPGGGFICRPRSSGSLGLRFWLNNVSRRWPWRRFFWRSDGTFGGTVRLSQNSALLAKKLLQYSQGKFRPIQTEKKALTTLTFIKRLPHLPGFLAQRNPVRL